MDTTKTETRTISWETIAGSRLQEIVDYLSAIQDLKDKASKHAPEDWADLDAATYLNRLFEPTKWQVLSSRQVADMCEVSPEDLKYACFIPEVQYSLYDGGGIGLGDFVRNWVLVCPKQVQFKVVEVGQWNYSEKNGICSDSSRYAVLRSLWIDGQREVCREVNLGPFWTRAADLCHLTWTMNPMVTVSKAEGAVRQLVEATFSAVLEWPSYLSYERWAIFGPSSPGTPIDEMNRVDLPSLQRTFTYYGDLPEIGD